MENSEEPQIEKPKELGCLLEALVMISIVFILPGIGTAILHYFTPTESPLVFFLFIPAMILGYYISAAFVIFSGIINAIASLFKRNQSVIDSIGKTRVSPKVYAGFALGAVIVFGAASYFIKDRSPFSEEPTQAVFLTVGVVYALYVGYMVDKGYADF